MNQSGLRIFLKSRATNPRLKEYMQVSAQRSDGYIFILFILKFRFLLKIRSFINDISTVPIHICFRLQFSQLYHNEINNYYVLDFDHIKSANI